MSRTTETRPAEPAVAAAPRVRGVEVTGDPAGRTELLGRLGAPGPGPALVAP
ncbi:hypothetical protein [Streptomyces sp. BK79]|uniref:hypothetical protein n=1 Tax=Streptomyces sp. BK79 TaxID=3350097 RepID=UPI0037705D57